MSDINLIKTVLFNAQNLNEALTKLTELGIEYRACTFTDNGYHITGHDITFWPTQSLRCPLAVCINGNLFDYDDRLSFLAGQCETVETPVPAASPDTTGQRLVTLSRNAVTGTVSYLSIKTIPFQTLRNTLREERRLKGSRVKGLSS